MKGLASWAEGAGSDLASSNHKLLSKEIVKGLTSGEGAIFQSPLSIWRPTHSCRNARFMGGNPRPHEAEGMKGKRSTSPKLSSPNLQRSPQRPVLWLKLWAITPGVHGRGPKSITSSLSSVIHMAFDPKKYLPALFSGTKNLIHPNQPTSSSICRQQGRENDCFFKRPFPHGTPTMCNDTPPPHWLKAYGFNKRLTYFLFLTKW